MKAAKFNIMSLKKVLFFFCCCCCSFPVEKFSSVRKLFFSLQNFLQLAELPQNFLQLAELSAVNRIFCIWQNFIRFLQLPEFSSFSRIACHQQSFLQNRIACNQQNFFSVIRIRLKKLKRVCRAFVKTFCAFIKRKNHYSSESLEKTTMSSINLQFLFFLEQNRHSLLLSKYNQNLPQAFLCRKNLQLHHCKILFWFLKNSYCRQVCYQILFLISALNLSQKVLYLSNKSSSSIKKIYSFSLTIRTFCILFSCFCFWKNDNDE